MNKTCFDKRTC